MKELSIEEKAKRYDEAIKKAKSKIKDDKDHVLYEDDVIEIFPELKESEDERIRKELIEFVKSRGGFKQEYIAWLEKQCEQSLDKVAKEVTKDKGTAISFLKSCGIMNDNGELAEEYRTEQGEQKPTDKVEPKLKIEVNKWYICISQYCNCIEGRCYMASADGRIIDDFGTEYDMHSDAYKYFRLWTIQDAKSGDVLINWNNTTFIFKAIGDESVKFHIAYNEKWDTVKTPSTKLSHLGLPEPQFEFHPATKEQRNFLFQKMHEAGYEWDSDKKELKKIEQKPTAWSEDDQSNFNELSSFILETYRTEDASRLITWLNDIKDRVQPQLNQELSEEDERIWIETIELLENCQSS